MCHDFAVTVLIVLVVSFVIFLAFISSKSTGGSSSTVPLTGDRVYFIQGKSGGAVKIGHSSDPEHRLKRLQTGNSEPLRIIAMISGGAAKEAELHRKFSHLNIQGEWFNLGPDLHRYIVEIRTGQQRAMPSSDARAPEPKSSDVEEPKPQPEPEPSRIVIARRPNRPQIVVAHQHPETSEMSHSISNSGNMDRQPSGSLPNPRQSERDSDIHYPSEDEINKLMDFFTESRRED